MRKKKIRVKYNIPSSLQQTTLLMLIVLLLFFCMMFMIATSIISSKTENDFKKRTSETAVNNLVTAINSNLVNYNYLSRLIMINDRVVTFLKSEDPNNDQLYEARKGIYEIQTLYSNIDSVYIFRLDNLYVTTARGEYLVVLSEEEKEEILKPRGSTVISINGNGAIHKKNGDQLLTLSRAIYDINSQKLIGLLIMNIRSTVFDDAMAIQDLGGMCIIDNKGNYLCGDEVIASLYKPKYNSEEFVCENIRLEGDKKFLSGKIAVNPLIVLCVSGRGSEALPWETILALLITLSAFIISGAICAWFITTNIARPIAKLSEAMERTESSGWLNKIDTEMPDNELGQLADSYNSMIEYLNDLFKQLIENEKNVQKAEMRVLQEQIKPHFLYNSLETISYMAVQEHALKVHDALETLGNFYRNFLSKGDREIPLKRELRITQDYLSLQKLRYGDIFNDEYEIDENSMDFMIPKLILQPLVENCIYHGVRLKGEQGIIRITTKIDENGLHIKVYDTGVGMSEEEIQKVLEAKEDDKVDALSGFGLRGTINRIRYYCNCKDVVSIKSEIGEFTEVSILIPNRREAKGDLECIES